MSAGQDGFKRGTNYNRRIGGYDPGAELAAAVTLQVTQTAKCVGGQHVEEVSEPRRVTYVRGRRVPVGTRWCRWCGLIIEMGSGPVP